MEGFSIFSDSIAQGIILFLSHHFKLSYGIRNNLFLISNEKEMTLYFGLWINIVDQG